MPSCQILCGLPILSVTPEALIIENGMKAAAFLSNVKRTNLSTKDI